MSKSGASMKMKLTFPKKVLHNPLIHQISRDMDVIPNILRGRITDKNAWLEIEFQGAAKSLDKVRKFLADQGVTIEELG